MLRPKFPSAHGCPRYAGFSACEADIFSCAVGGSQPRDGGSKIDAKKRTDDAQPDVQPTCIQTTHCDLPAGYTLNAGKVDEQAVVTISIGQRFLPRIQSLRSEAI